MRNRVPEILAVIALVLALVGLLHQIFASTEAWFSWQQFWHHESLIVVCVVAAVALVAGKYLGRLEEQPFGIEY